MIKELKQPLKYGSSDYKLKQGVPYDKGAKNEKVRTALSLQIYIAKQVHISFKQA